MRKAVTACSMLVDLVDDALDVTRIEQGRVHLVEEPFSPPGLLSSFWSAKGQWGVDLAWLAWLALLAWLAWLA